ncbi:unnamed protein product [Chondrus crispus]|uniref:Reverse transcriptase Ty1/copia-type domain-containing protein n=1 Tax=Chondrus crispus TaxID=2769 RepID=R7QHT7_CHOCR|nr:unnamed protein product [Chondrus crispus]CDF38077.1 unnamed protein product [Chondrus crispus]|eukprot:XP_005717946.1 unnamed protein product [Chondrus crispus]
MNKLSLLLKVRVRATIDGKATMAKVPYRQLVGSLLHLANTTRPDIAFAAGLLSRHLESPELCHWNAAKHVLRYLKGTATLGIQYNRDTSSSNTIDFHGYSDPDCEGDQNTRKSTSGFVFILAGGAISWRSKKQTVTAQSTVEAEYITFSYAIRELLWFRKMIEDVYGKRLQKTILYGDHQGALSLASNEIQNERTKHIDVKYHFNKDYIADHTVILQYVSTEKMTADVMTKALGSVKHRRCVEELGMKAAEERD